MRAGFDIAAAALSALALAQPVAAQNLIVQDGWQGFAVRSPDGKFDRCILYNRTVEALNASPFDMIGLSRDGAGRIGLIVFFQPRSFTRGAQLPVKLKLDQRAALSLAGDVVSDFHVVVPGPFSADTVAALREAASVEITVENKTVKIAVAGVGAVLDRLADCVNTYAR